MTLGRVMTAVAVSAIMARAACVQATFTGPMLEIHVESALGSGSWSIEFDPQYYDPGAGVYLWSLSDDIAIRDSVTGEFIAMLSSESALTALFYQDDPIVSLGFVVINGGADAQFTVTSSLLSFANIPDAEATASAGMTLTDLDGDGASLTGLNPGGGAYLAQYNGAVPGGTTFADLLPGLSTVNPFDTVSDSDSTGLFQPIGSVDDMSTRFDFLLTANDSASGTSTFVVVPGPSALVALAVGMLLTGRRRRTV